MAARFWDSKRPPLTFVAVAGRREVARTSVPPRLAEVQEAIAMAVIVSMPSRSGDPTMTDTWSFGLMHTR